MDVSDIALVFPSERGTLMSRDNFLRRNFQNLENQQTESALDQGLWFAHGNSSQITIIYRLPEQTAESQIGGGRDAPTRLPRACE